MIKHRQSNLSSRWWWVFQHLIYGDVIEVVNNKDWSIIKTNHAYAHSSLLNLHQISMSNLLAKLFNMNMSLNLSLSLSPSLSRVLILNV